MSVLDSLVLQELRAALARPFDDPVQMFGLAMRRSDARVMERRLLEAMRVAALPATKPEGKCDGWRDDNPELQPVRKRRGRRDQATHRRADGVPAGERAREPLPLDRADELRAGGDVGGEGELHLAADPKRKHGADAAVQKGRIVAEPVSRSAAGRSAAATSEIMDVTAGETAPKRWLPPRRRSIDLEDLEEILTDRLSPPRDLTRFIAAMRAKPRPAPPPVPRKLQPAFSREECPHCGIPGFKGCSHQLPYEGAPC